MINLELGVGMGNEQSQQGNVGLMEVVMASKLYVVVRATKLRPTLAT